MFDGRSSSAHPRLPSAFSKVLEVDGACVEVGHADDRVLRFGGGSVRLSREGIVIRSRAALFGFKRRELVLRWAETSFAFTHRELIFRWGGTSIALSRDEIVLRSGEGFIKLTRDGRITISGLYVESRAKGVNRIRGGNVLIN